MKKSQISALPSSLQDMTLQVIHLKHDDTNIMTIAHTLAWALYLISGHPEVEKKLIEEVDTV